MGACGGNKNSPIDITGAQAAEAADGVDALNFIQTNIEGKSFEAIMNNASSDATHSLKFSLKPEVIGATAKCDQFHFHFDKSEHTLNGAHSFAEVHMVCYHPRYVNISTAFESGKEDSFRVFGFWIAEDEHADDNAEIQAIIDLKNAHPNGADSVNLKFPTPAGLSSSAYYRYMGGLTTPTCNEIVEWTVFATKVAISKSQADVIRTWRDGHINGNNRDVQALNGRSITVYNPKTSGWSTTTIVVTLVVFVVLLAAIVMIARGKRNEPKHAAGDRV